MRLDELILFLHSQAVEMLLRCDILTASKFALGPCRTQAVG